MILLRNIFIAAVVLLCGFIDAPRLFGIRGISVLGLLTIGYAFLSWALWLPSPRISLRTIKTVWPLALFLLWGLTTFSWYRPNTVGFQNLLVIAMFLGMILLVAAHAKYPLTSGIISILLQIAVWFAVALFALSYILRSRGGAIVGDRSFAIFAVLGICLYLSLWRKGSQTALAAAVILTLLIGFSLSRLAFGIALLLFPLSYIGAYRFKHIVKMTFCAVIVITLGYFAVMKYEPLRARFFTGDIYRVGNVGINATGRRQMWTITLKSVSTSPIVGHGAGSTAEVMMVSLGDITHAHNEYLRMLHDYGAIGLALWLFAISSLLYRPLKLWRTSRSAFSRDRYVHLAAFLATAGLAMAMTAANVVAYPYIMAPIGVLIGLSLGTTTTHLPEQLCSEAGQQHGQPVHAV